ncbi:MAG TPA: hypothetical protein DCP91_12330 [Eggerthellaceae bacterium]|nr:hypothetical protein [Eggerthellaceae bacterium]
MANADFEKAVVDRGGRWAFTAPGRWGFGAAMEASADYAHGQLGAAVQTTAFKCKQVSVPKRNAAAARRQR